MKLITKIAAGALLGFGIPISFLALAAMLDAKNTSQNKWESGLALVTLGLPPTVLGGWLALGSQRAGQREDRDRLQSMFFRLLKESNGHLTVIRFAMESGLDGEAAKSYLDDRAKEFNAIFNVTEAGGVSYYFDLGGTVSGVLPARTAEETYDVVLAWVPPSKRRLVVREIRALKSLEWRQAKALVKQLPKPVTIQQQVPKATAEEFRQRLEALGAEVLVILN
jgi:ribosomal protein L7/L12